MGWFGKIVGGGVGALIGGPAGAAVGFGLGALYDSAASQSAQGLEEGLLAGSTVTVTPDETGAQIVIETATALPEAALCAMTFLSDSQQALSSNRRSGDRFRNDEGQLLIAGAVRGHTISWS